MTFGWAVLAPGEVADFFARDLSLVEDARLVAVGSRSLERATAFAEVHGGRPYGSYEEAVSDPEVDIVYVASPHTLHPEHVRLALAAGKAVLCEKPLAVDAAEATALFAEARDRGLFLMEAMWMACHPLIREMVRRVRAGDAGEVRQVAAGLGFAVGPGEADRLFDPELGGGSLLDMGIYPVTLAALLLGDPDELTGAAVLSEAAVDLDIAIAARYPGGATAALASSVTASLPNNATVATTTGRFELATEFHHPPSIAWVEGTSDEERREELTASEAIIGDGYGNEILEVHRCLAADHLSSALVPPEQTIAVLGQLDRLRTSLGILR